MTVSNETLGCHLHNAVLLPRGKRNVRLMLQWTWTMFLCFDISYSQTYFLSDLNGLEWNYQKNTKPLSRNYDVIRKTMYVEGNIEALLCNYCCSGKTISICTLWVVFVALGIQHAMLMRPIHLRTVRLYHIFPHYLIIEWFSIKKFKNKMCFEFIYKVSLQSFYTNFLYKVSVKYFEIFLIIWRTAPGVIKHFYWSPWNYTVFLPGFKETEVSRQIF